MLIVQIRELALIVFLLRDLIFEDQVLYKFCISQTVDLILETVLHVAILEVPVHDIRLGQRVLLVRPHAHNVLDLYSPPVTFLLAGPLALLFRIGLKLITVKRLNRITGLITLASVLTHASPALFPDLDKRHLDIYGSKCLELGLALIAGVVILCCLIKPLGALQIEVVFEIGRKVIAVLLVYPIINEVFVLFIKLVGIQLVHVSFLRLPSFSPLYI